MYITQLIKRLLGFYQTPRTILGGTQYSWAIPLDVCHTHNTPTDRPTHRDIHLHSSAAIRIYLAMLDRPTHSEHPIGSLGRAVDDCLVNTINTHSDIHAQHSDTGGGRDLQKSE